MFDLLKWIGLSNKQSKITVSSEVIERAYERRSKDIDSLRQYDKGEKEIHAPNYRDIVSSVRNAA